MAQILDLDENCSQGFKSHYFFHNVACSGYLPSQGGLVESGRRLPGLQLSPREQIRLQAALQGKYRRSARPFNLK